MVQLASYSNLITFEAFLLHKPAQCYEDKINNSWPNMHIWAMTACSDVVRYQCFGGPCYLHLQGHTSPWRREAAWPSERPVSYITTPCQ